MPLDITYRDELGTPLSYAQVDSNFHAVEDAIDDLIANPPEPNSVTSITASGLSFVFHFSDTTTITLPIPFVGQVRRGEWLPVTFYAALDTVRVTGVGGFWAQLDHTSPAVFDPDQLIDGEPVWVKEFDEAPLVEAPADLADMGDVSITSPANYDFAQYQTSDSKWHNRTPTEATASLVAVVGDSGSPGGGIKGLVPAPAAGDAAAGKFLKADGTFAVPSGSGLSATLTSAHIYVGNGSAVATDVAASGDLTLANTGAFTIAANAVTNAKAAQMAAHRFKGNNTGSTANAIDLTATEITAELNAMVGDSGSGGTKGLVPAPGSGDAAAGKFLKADGTYAVPAGTSGITQLTGDVTAGSGSGSQAATLATVNSNVGSFTAANITVNAKGLVTAAANGSAGGGSTNTFIYPAMTNSVLFTNGGSNAYASTAAISASVSAGDAYRISMVISGWATASKCVGFLVLNGNVTNTKGYYWLFNTDGKLYLYTYNNNTFPTNLAASSTSRNNQAPDFCLLEGTIVFGTTVNQLCFTSDGTMPMAGGDNIVAFPGSPFYLGIVAPTFADIKKVTVERLNP